MDIFDRYAPFIQDFIYENRWENLRAIQVAAGEAIFNTDQNVLLCASTASGKTEAAFFPILTLFSEDEPRSVGCIYVAPLKALINDQFLRLNDLCRDAQVPVWHWHGDVSASEKKRLMKKPSGILQITPESLEALLMHKHADIPSLFGDLRFVVIDEIHSMLRGDRGGQTLCLIERLSRLAGVRPRRIGLSATIGDTKKAGAFLSAGSGRGCVIPRIETKGVQWRLSMEHFYNSAPQADEAWYTGTDAMIPGTVQSASPTAVPSGRQEQDTAASHLGAIKKEPAPEILAPRCEATDKAPYAADPGCGYIFEHTRGKKCLVFTNSREECEAVTTTLRQYCEKNHEPDRFLIHHGNLATSFRQSAEEQMKDDDNRMTICTTSTLELGIDIGRLERAFQVEAPFTVSSFLQRMGRTGRRMREEHAEPRDLFPDTIPWSLIQGIALVQLYLEERWVEPPRDGRLPYSLL